MNPYSAPTWAGQTAYTPPPVLAQYRRAGWDAILAAMNSPRYGSQSRVWGYMFRRHDSDPRIPEHYRIKTPHGGYAFPFLAPGGAVGEVPLAIDWMSRFDTQDSDSDVYMYGAAFYLDSPSPWVPIAEWIDPAYRH